MNDFNFPNFLVSDWMLYGRRHLIRLSQSGFKQLLSQSLPDKFHYSKLLKYFIFAGFLLIEDYEQGAPRKELIFAPFVERFITATLRKSS